MLTRAVDALERLLSEKTRHTVLRSESFHKLHSEKVLVNCDIGGRENGSKLVLCGSRLVMLGLRADTELPKLTVKLCHKCVYLFGKNAEIVVVKLLTLNCGRTEKGSSAIEEVAASLEITLVDKEILLLCADGGIYSRRCIVAEEAKNTKALVVYGVHRAKKGRFGIKRLARIGAECGGYVKRAVLYECVGSRVPSGVASRLKGCSYAT